jgi:hypothetical protein
MQLHTLLNGLIEHFPELQGNHEVAAAALPQYRQQLQHGLGQLPTSSPPVDAGAIEQLLSGLTSAKGTRPPDSA